MVVQTRSKTFLEKNEEVYEKSILAPVPSKNNESKEIVITKTTTTIFRIKTDEKSSILNPKSIQPKLRDTLSALAVAFILSFIVLGFSYGFDSSFSRFYNFILHFDVNEVIFGLKNWNSSSALFYLGIVLQLVIFSITLPGEEVDGLPLRNKSRLRYKVNGLNVLLLFSLVSYMILRVQGLSICVWIRVYFADISLIAIIFTLCISIYVYCESFIGDKMLSSDGNTGNFIYDFLFGRELNPRFGDFDLKFFTVLRPGLVLWLIFNISFGICQWIELGRFTYSMILVNLLQGWYVLDMLINEHMAVASPDIAASGFGFFFVFENLCWVPIIHSLQTRYLVDHPIDLPQLYLAICFAIHSLGYSIFRSSSSERYAVYKNSVGPKVSRLDYMETSTGVRLITTGWWGKARHVNYFGTWLMSLSWSLLCGFDSLVPYFPFVCHTLYLVYQQYQAEKKCSIKYSTDWDLYCNVVKHRIIPGVY